MSQASKESLIQLFKTVFDPIIPVNIWDLGLIYEIDLDDPKVIQITMTFPSQNNAKRENFATDIKNLLETSFPLQRTQINVIFQPAWSPIRMNEDAKNKLGIQD